MTTVFTIGYEGATIDSFIDTLKAVGIKTVADVRAVALSRKKGFSKSALRARLEAEGIEYLHFIALGDPKPGREAARSGRTADFKKIYDEHLGSSDAQSAIASLAKVCAKKATCLLCFERDPQTCHRTIVAEKMPLTNHNIFELYGDLPKRYHKFAEQFARYNSRQGATAA
jgi:uncharacterized protein (DUF488 family)